MLIDFPRCPSGACRSTGNTETSVTYLLIYCSSHRAPEGCVPAFASSHASSSEEMTSRGMEGRKYARFISSSTCGPYRALYQPSREDMSIQPIVYATCLCQKTRKLMQVTVAHLHIQDDRDIWQEENEGPTETAAKRETVHRPPFIFCIFEAGH